MIAVVSYSISTSNHNPWVMRHFRICVVSYSISTSNHNSYDMHILSFRLYLIPFLHQTTTLSASRFTQRCCILFHFYIKPQRKVNQYDVMHGCILFHFYIKPQPEPNLFYLRLCCILFHFYIKPQR